MTPIEVLSQKAHNSQGWSLMLTEECSAVVDQVDSLESTVDAIYVILRKLDIYLPIDGYPNTLVKSAIDLIDNYWRNFTPNDLF